MNRLAVESRIKEPLGEKRDRQGTRGKFAHTFRKKKRHVASAMRKGGLGEGAQ